MTLMANLPEGILLVDKPVGISSFDVIRRLRRARGVKKLGHAGTLDPLASGLMIIGEGKATKLLSQFLKLPKTYLAEVCIGESTTTGDKEGEVLRRLEVRDMSEETVRKKLVGMIGTRELPVPAYSAIKQGGVPLYKKARRGQTVDVPIKPMEVRSAELMSLEHRDGLCFVRVQFDVGSGTYIRSLAEELGKRLGFPARLENLRRTQIGEWRVEDAQPTPEYSSAV
jgi:tRNA pseudouridine55 synthase